MAVGVWRLAGIGHWSDVAGAAHGHLAVVAGICRKDWARAWLRFFFFCGPSRRALCLLAYVSRTRVYAMPKTSAKATKKRKQDASNFKTYIARARTRGACGGAREGAACCTILDRCVRRAGAVGRSGAVVVCRDRVHGAH